jgi:hypothetical protein
MFETVFLIITEFFFKMPLSLRTRRLSLLPKRAQYSIFERIEGHFYYNNQARKKSTA